MLPKYNITSQVINKNHSQVINKNYPQVINKNPLDQDCFCSSTKKIIKYNPNFAINEVPVTRAIFDKKFPKFKKVNPSLLKITNVGLYSIATPYISKSICNYILKYLHTTKITITDALGNVGGMTLMFAHIFNKINVCEIIPLNCKVLSNNLSVYGLLHKVNIICGDYFDHMLKLKQDVIFLDPPWGGYDYKKVAELSLCLNNINIACIHKLLKYTKYIFLLVPSNFNFDYFFKKLFKLNKNVKINLHSLCDKLDGTAKILIVIYNN